MPTIRDVAAAAGVSVTTVSRVLNEKGDVAADTVQRVQQVIDDLGFFSSLAASSMRSRRSWVIGIVLPDMDHSWGVEVVKAASRVVTGTRYDLFVMTSGRRSHEARGRWEQQQVTRLNGALTDGVLVIVPDSREFRTDNPLVAVDPFRQTDAYPSVIGDNRAATLEAMRYLFGLGHRRVAHLRGLDYLESATQRLHAYRDAFVEAGIERDAALEVEGDFSTLCGAESTRRLLALPNPPTAIFAANDDMAFGALNAARDLGVRVPEQLSILGFDNVTEAAFTNPPLTTVDQGIERIVRAAIYMLIDLIEGRPLATNSVVVPAHLVVRASCAPPAAYAAP